MLPDFIMHAIIQKLPQSQLDRLVRKAGFDPDNLIPPLSRDMTSKLPYRGELDFNLTVGAFGESHMLPCRTIWAAELMNDPETSQRVVNQIQCQMYLLARSQEHDGLEWRSLDFDLMSRAIFEAMDAQIEQQARQQELARKSSS